MTISKDQIEAMDDCMEYSATLPKWETEIEEDYTTIPLICLLAWVLFVAGCAWIDAGFPMRWPT